MLKSMIQLYVVHDDDDDSNDNKAHNNLPE